MKRNRTAIIFFASLLIAMPVRSDQNEKEKFFSESVEPVLSEHCYECHSHESGVMEGDLTLDWKSGWEKGGSRGPAIIPGKPEESLLIKAINHTDPDLQMPDEKLNDQEIAVLTNWVRQGAFDPRQTKPKSDLSDKTDWWSLQPLVRPEIPANGNSNPIDAFIHARLKKEGLKPSPVADRKTLIRRIMFDLHGITPTIQETEEFVSNEDPKAWESLIEKLLASPRYGERWARHWLDTVHYADTHGFEHDAFRPNAWRYRDYVIDRLNQDIPWSRFVKEQLAADYFYPDQPELTPALGFLGAGPYDQSTAATAPKTFAYLDRDDLVTQVMGAFVSTTANCARCHAHKFDPITQEDYYALQAVFSGIAKGDLHYDQDLKTAQLRSHWKDIQQAAETHNPGILLTEENLLKVSAWEELRTRQLNWKILNPEVFVSTGGADLKRLEDGSILSAGKRPEVETIVFTTGPLVSGMTALKLEVIKDESLPEKGPGRTDNGNLHLSEIEFRLFSEGESEGKLIPVRLATADFNQDSWTIQHAIDGNDKTAWGIYPQVGQSHHAVFEFEKPVNFHPGTRLVVTMKQLHGGSHIIGRFRISISDSTPYASIALPAKAEEALSIPAEKRTEEQKLLLASSVLKYHAQEELNQLPPLISVYGAASDVESGIGKIKLDKPAEIRLLARGDIEKPRNPVGPGALSAISDLESRFPETDEEAKRRAALANWLVDSKNSLSWRSIANRIWHYHFGQGLCNTPNDFGQMGGTPSHPELLDWLACELRDNGGSLKQIHRLICQSKTFQQASFHRPELSKRDPDNRLLARMSRKRMDSESFRDSILLISGRINWKRGGPGVEHFSKSPGAQITPILDYNDFDMDDPKANRRSIYRIVWRGIPDPIMEALDFPDLGLMTPARGFSASPLQSLILFNNRLILHHSQQLANQARNQSPSLDQQVNHVVKLTWLREPTEEEQKQFVKLAENHGLESVCRLLFNSNEFLFIE